MSIHKDAGLERIIGGHIEVEYVSDTYSVVKTEVAVPMRLNKKGAERLVQMINSGIIERLQSFGIPCYGPSIASKVWKNMPDHPEGQPFKAIYFTGNAHTTAVHAKYDPFYQGKQTKLLIEIEISSDELAKYRDALKTQLETQIKDIDMDGMAAYRIKHPTLKQLVLPVYGALRRMKDALTSRKALSYVSK